MNTTSQMAGFAAKQSWADLFRTIWPKHTRKMVSIAGDLTLRRAKDLVEDVSRPTGDEVLLMARNAAVRARLMQILKEIDVAENRAIEFSQPAADCRNVVVHAGSRALSHSRSVRSSSNSSLIVR